MEQPQQTPILPVQDPSRRPLLTYNECWDALLLSKQCCTRAVQSPKGEGVDDGNRDEPEPSGKSQYRDTRFAAAAKDPSHSFETDPVNE
jgi:hypothetical protein